ncbi:hypothetical protein M433DRAFT_158626 [Acidomyces richmondensis BFW]|nr:MAG: hypothetical protein FE78DRAFT_86017 [Acidomyces sp. 'richmondensis']KYG41812.1 hypothetical protein M433DRAFT_158626 [Acidomyces richmondensis BFW]
MAADNSLDQSYLFHQLDNYPWDQDHEFQGGLRAILGSVQNPEQVQHLTLRAKCYYYARKANTHVDFDGYKQWVENNLSSASVAPPNGTGNDYGQTPQLDDGYVGGMGEENVGVAGGGMSNAPKPASFADICEMIAEGKPIPGIKEIPSTILEGQASESQMEKRKKPWEKDTSLAVNESQEPSWMR